VHHHHVLSAAVALRNNMDAAEYKHVVHRST